jgi:hypothetical protein
MIDFTPDEAHAERIADLLQEFDARDFLQLKLEVALLVIEESPKLDTLCQASTLLRACDGQEHWLPLMGYALHGPINRLYSASKKAASKHGAEELAGEAARASACPA